MLKLRRFLESLMGIDPVAPGEDTQWQIRWDLAWPDWFVVLFIIGAVAWIVGIYLREGAATSRRYKLFLASIRLVVVAIVVMMIGGLELAIDRTGLPHLVFMIDDSESMQVRDHLPGDSPARSADGPTRLGRVADWFDAERLTLMDLTEHHKLQAYAHSRSPRLLGTSIKPQEVSDLVQQIHDLAPAGTESRLGANLRTVLNALRGTPPSAVVLITDGVTTHGESLIQAAQYAARKGIPVFAVGVGDPEARRDLELRDLLVDDVVFVDDVVTFELNLVGHGFEGAEVPVALRQKGIAEPLDQKTIRVGKDQQPFKVRLSHRPTIPGTIIYTLEVPTQDREIQVENNRIERSIQVVKEKVRVLYVESYPRYEFRYLKNLLERERTVELGVLLLDADPEYVQQDRAAIGFFPTNKQDLFAYDVLILGDVPPTVFSQAQINDIRDFVRVKGGGLLHIAGREFAPHGYRDTPLADLLPVELGAASGSEWPASGAFRPQLTVDGRASPIFRFSADDVENDRIWNGLPELFGYLIVAKGKPAAHVLAEHPSGRDGQPTPLVATQFFGAGRTFFQAFDCTWRWRFRSEDFYYSRYWIQTIRYLSRAKLLGKSRSVELQADRRTYQRSEPIYLRVRFHDESLAPKGADGVNVLVEREGFGRQTLELKRMPSQSATFEVVMSQAADGRYRVRLASPLIENDPPTVEFQVVPPPGELDRVRMNEAELRQVAELTGGRYYRLAEAAPLLSALPPGQRVALHTDPPFPLWRTWPVLAVFVALLVVEWVLRKRAALL
jgi:uncharacterized membrane protein